MQAKCLEAEVLRLRGHCGDAITAVTAWSVLLGLARHQAHHMGRMEKYHPGVGPV